MPKTAAPDWAAIRRRYVETDAAVANIADDAGISRSDLDNARKREGWKRQKPRGPPPGRRATAAASVPPPETPLPETPLLPVTSASRSPAAPKCAARPAQPKSKRKPARSTATPSGRRHLLDRMVAAISLKLEQLERRMAQDLADDDAQNFERSARSEAASATDHERETRAIGALIDNLGKVTEMETGLDRSAARGKSPASAADIAGEADRYRHELAERLAKIVSSATPRS